MKTKCTKCDERGYISKRENGTYYGRSCECGWAIAQQEMHFEGVTFGELLAYGAARIDQKRAQSNEPRPL